MNVKYENKTLALTVEKSIVRLIFFFLKSRPNTKVTSQGKNDGYAWKDLVTKNTHVKNQNSSTHCSTIISKVNFVRK